MKFTNDNKYHFGAYLNMAYDNFNDTVKYIALAVCHSKQSEPILTLCAALKDNNFSSQKIEEKISQAFPFWNVICPVFLSREGSSGKTLGELKAMLMYELCNMLKDLRNYTIHSVHDEVVMKTIIIETLNLIYEKALNRIRHRFTLSNDELQHLYLTDKNGKPQISFYQLINERKNELTEKGLVFFTCLFLYKRDAYHFLKKIHGFKRDDEKRYRFTLEVFTIMRFHAPKRLMKLQQKADDQLSLGMDILNELSKCPKELYSCIAEDSKKQYQVRFDADDYSQEIISERIRYKDRYEILALRVLEYSTECSDMGFYMHFGKCYMKSYQKTYIDGSKDYRYIVFPLSGFGQIRDSFFRESTTDDSYLSVFGRQLMEVSQMRVQHTTYNDSFEDAKKTYSVPYISEAYPSYIVNDNKIGIKRLSVQKKTIFPSFNLNDGKVYCPQPDYWLSKYELPAMLFYAYLKEHHQELREFLSIWELIDADFPKKIKKKRNFSKVKEDRIKCYIEETEERLKQILEDCYLLNDGQIADELARDILWIQPSVDNGKNKLTSANFRVLEYTLAQYSYKKDELMDVFIRSGIIGGNTMTSHPFLAKVLPTNNKLVDYYISYLRHKIKYLKAQEKKLAKGISKINFYPFRKLNRVHESSEDHSLKFLPRNLFTKHIKEALEVIRPDLKNEINRLLNVNGRINASKLFQIYFSIICKDDLPVIYKENRIYNYEEGSMIHTKAFSLQDREKLIDGKKGENTSNTFNDMFDNEKKIRLRGIQDISLCLWMNKFLSEHIPRIPLSNLGNKVLSQDYLYKKTIDGIGVKIEGKVKLRDYGRLDSLLIESLPYSLMGLVSQIYKKIDRNNREPLSYEYIQREMEAFVHYLPMIIQLAQAFEQNAIIALGNKINKETGGYYNFRDLATKYSEEFQDSINHALLIKIRNIFSHNNYPYKDEDYNVLEECFDYAKTIEFIKGAFSANKTEMRALKNTLAYCMYDKFKIECEKIAD